MNIKPFRDYNEFDLVTIFGGTGKSRYSEWLQAEFQQKPVIKDNVVIGKVIEHNNDGTFQIFCSPEILADLKKSSKPKKKKIG